MKYHQISRHLPTQHFPTSLFQQYVVQTEDADSLVFQENWKFLNVSSANKLCGILEMDQVAKN